MPPAANDRGYGMSIGGYAKVSWASDLIIKIVILLTNQSLNKKTFINPLPLRYVHFSLRTGVQGSDDCRVDRACRTRPITDH